MDFGMAEITNLLNAIEKLAPYMGKMVNAIGDAIKETQRKAAITLFQNITNELYTNLSILGTLNLNNYRTLKINDPKIKKLVNKELSTKYLEKINGCIQEIPQLKDKDTMKIIDRLSLVLHKILDIRLYANKSDKDLSDKNNFRPAVRIKNIRNTCLGINQLLNGKK